MRKIVDLSVFADQTLDIRLPDRRLLRLCKPPQRIVIHMLALRRLTEDTPEEEIVRTTDALVLDILRTNDAAVPITAEYVAAELSTAMKVAIIESYSDFIAGVQADPNS